MDSFGRRTPNEASRKQPMIMAEPAADWTTYIITTLVTAVGSMIAAIIALAKVIETKYVTEIKELKVHYAASEIKTELEISQIREASDKCEKDREELAIRLARLETKSCILDVKIKTLEADK